MGNCLISSKLSKEIWTKYTATATQYKDYPQGSKSGSDLSGTVSETTWSDERTVIKANFGIGALGGSFYGQMRINGTWQDVGGISQSYYAHTSILTGNWKNVTGLRIRYSDARNPWFQGTELIEWYVYGGKKRLHRSIAANKN